MGFRSTKTVCPNAYAQAYTNALKAVVLAAQEALRSADKACTGWRIGNVAVNISASVKDEGFERPQCSYVLKQVGDQLQSYVHYRMFDTAQYKELGLPDGPRMMLRVSRERVMHDVVSVHYELL